MATFSVSAVILLYFGLISVQRYVLVTRAQTTDTPDKEATLGTVLLEVSPNTSEANPAYNIKKSTRSTTPGPNNADKGGNEQCPSACYMYPVDDRAAARIKEMKGDKVLLMEFNLKLTGYDDGRKNPLRPGNFSRNYNPGHWVRTGTNHGFTLMALEFNYEILSLMMLRFRTDETDVHLKESVPGCLANVTEECKVNLMEELILKEFDPNKTKPAVSAGENVCHQVVRELNGFADFSWKCCNSDGHCAEKESSLWLTILNVLITLFMYGVILFGPLLVPAWAYSFKADKEGYVLRLPDGGLKKRVFVTEDKVPKVINPKHALTTQDIANFKKFKAQVSELPRNTIIERMLPKFHLSIDYKELLDESKVPVGVMNLIYRMFCQCQIRRVGPCVPCCKASLLGCCHREFPVKWIHFWQGVVVFLFILLLPFPFYIRLMLYFGYEHEEILARKRTIDALGLSERYESNLLQFLTPSHPVFIACYVLYFVTCLVFCLAYANVIGTGKVQVVMKKSFRDLHSISYFNIIGMVVGAFLLPLKMCGCFGLIVGVIYWPLVMPFVLLAAVIYSLPTVYLTVRMMLNVHLHVIPTKQQLKRRSTVKGMKREFSDGLREVRGLMDVTDKTKTAKQNEIIANNDGDDQCNYLDESKVDRPIKEKCLSIIKEICVVILCLAFLYTCMLLLAEVAELIVQVIVFTLMGIIVNAGITLKYISLLFLVALYSYDCYNAVYKTYLDLSKKIISDVNGRIPEVKEVTRLPSSLQQNEAFKLKIETDYDQEGIEADFSPKHKHDYEISSLVLFIDKNDNPRIPRKLFEKMCQIEVAGAPGPVYKSLLRATAKFVCILIFLLFVFIVVATFGNIYKITSTNQMFATLAGGFIPFMLRNFLSPGGAATGYKSSVSWQAKFDETIVNFRQHWPMADIELVCIQEEMGDMSDEKIGGKNNDGDAMAEIELRNDEPQSPTMDNSEVDLLIQVVRRKRPTLGEILTGKGLSKTDYKPVDV